MPRGDPGRIGIIPACAGSTVFDALTHDAVPLHEHFERQRVRFAEVATARDLVPLRGLELVRLDGRQLLEQHREPLFGNKKAAPKDGLRGGRICTYVSSIKGTPRTVLLSVLLIFPYVRHPINHGPLVRREPCCALRRIGIIPACAGNTKWIEANPEAWQGSSPRVRGTQALVHAVDALLGIIPACAGNTPRRNSRRRSSWDHPRVCGEHGERGDSGVTTPGSSPRVRGTLEHNRGWPAGMGIIPACAGNTSLVNQIVLVQWDHPRVCGEHFGGVTVYAVCVGSSPRMRGTLSGGMRLIYGYGIIPAYAGNTAFDSREIIKARDHPRVCGEHSRMETSSRSRSGSSPRMRGTRAVAIVSLAHAGIIPAYAGNTAEHMASRHRSWDHPRVCGEHENVVVLNNGLEGSSPRVRGTRLGILRPEHGVGIIPACAGNTL